MRHLLPLLFLVGCTTLGPDYERPEMPVPEDFRSTETLPVGDEDTPTFGELGWKEVFTDPALHGLIETALVNNHDVRLAAERVLEARSFLTITEADKYPDIAGGVDGRFTRDTKNGPGGLPPGADKDNESASALISLQWEIDFFGRVERATEAARAELLGTELAQGAVIQTLIADLAAAYYRLLALDAELAISHRTLESREKSLRLVALRLEHGVANKVELRQAEGLVLTAAGTIPEILRLIEQEENLIRLLIGDNPGPIERGLPLLEQKRTVDVPAGLPSELLERRPDVLIAEQALVAANARIGEAKALLYPSITLTGTGGVASEHLSDLFEHDSLTWSLVPAATAPIFNAGRLQANVEATESRQRQAAIRYLQTLQNAFREVGDALVDHSRVIEVREYRERYETTLADQARLSNTRYRGGVTSYLEVLDSDRDHFEAQQDVVRSLRDELFSVVFLYRALGGGWQIYYYDDADADADADAVADAVAGGEASDAEPE